MEATPANEIARIYDEAVALGWPSSRLLGVEFWPGEDRGLAAVLDPGDEIATVTDQFLEIAKWDGTRQRFNICPSIRPAQ